MTEVKNENTTQAPDPATINNEPPRLGMGDQVHFQRYQQKSNKVLWGIFLLLAVLVGAVFFVLPRYVSAPVPASTVVVPVAPPGAASPATAISPFEEAQRMRQREAAQNTLAALLTLQEELEKQQVLQWAEADFNQGIEHARSGDAAYREQQFEDAGARYQAGLDILQGIVDRQPQMYASFMAAGDAAILAGDATAADQAYSQALLIQPDSGEAVAGMERASVLNQVLALLDKGRDLQADQQLEAAQEQYRQAQAIDARHPDVNAALEQVSQAITERNFASAMSRGYAALQDGDPQSAQQEFQQALALKPGADEVETAMQQARDQQTFSAISVHIEAATRHESEEDWAAALAAWNEALTIDPNLVTALEGSARSESRNNLDQFLETTIDNPLRLAEDAIYQQTRQVLADAGRIANPGPKLLQQLQQVDAFLERARIPVTVQLQSDGMTMVTVYRIGEIGQFTSHTLNLVPGAYTAVGIRPGYRDVREEFVVAIDGQAPLVTVACNEAI